MFKLTRKSGPVTSVARFAALPVALLAFSAVSAPAQTAPQLLPYTSVLIAGGGAAATYTVGGTCPVSGYIETDAKGNGCLATEIFLGGGVAGTTTPGPRDAIADAAGNVFFSDYQDAMIRRVDALTGIVSVVAGGGTTAAGVSSGLLGTAVKLVHPAGVLLAANGDLYFTDPGNGQVFKVAATSGFVGGSVSSVSITSVGSGYTTAPTVTFSAPTSGTTATGTANISGGKVTGVTIVTAGSGYTSAPTVTFSAPTSGTTATGAVATTGVISLVAGNTAGTFGYAASNTVATNTPLVVTSANSYLRLIFGIAFDNNNDLLIADEYYYAIVAMNLSSSTNTVFNTTIPAGQIWKLVGTTSGVDSPYCVNGTASSSGCTNGLYSTGSGYAAGTQQANSDNIRQPFAVTVAPNGYLYGPDEYYDAVFKVSPAGVLTNFSGTPNTAVNYLFQSKALPRGPAGSFSMSSPFGIASDANNNVYIGDAANGVIWRVDGAVTATGQTQYVVAGGVGTSGAPATVCSGATDTLGDGCPALSAKIGSSAPSSNFATATLPGPGIYGLHVDANANLYFADTENNDVREIASGTQFGVIGANQPTQTLEIHFAYGDMPSSAGAYTLTAGATNFSLGTATCKATNSDGTTDCLLPITATPTALGSFTGTLQVKSALGGVGSFPLSGVYSQSPNTRTSVSYTTSITCSGTTTYSTATSVTATAIITANGPAPPTGASDTVTFTATNTATSTVTNLGTVQVTNTGTTASPVYSATTAPFTLPTVGTYSIAATFSGDTYFKTSSGTAPNTITTANPSNTLTSTGFQQNNVTAGQTALYSFNITQTVYTGTLSFAVTGLPANSSYAISPTTITGAGCSTTSTVALSIYTQAQSTVQPGSFVSGHGTWGMMTAFAGVLLAMAIGLRRRRIRFAQVWMALALLLATTGTVACGKAVGTVLQPATPAGTYTITVTPTSSTGTSPAAITFQLIVH